MKIISKLDRKRMGIETYREEMRLLQQLDHSHVIQLIEYFETKTDIYIVLEYCKCDLSIYLKRKGGYLKVEEVRVIALQLINGLYYLHKMSWFTMISSYLMPWWVQITEADFWLLGVVLYELYVGKTPFRTTSLADLKHNIMEEDIIWPREIPNEFKHFLQGLLKRDPVERMTWSQLKRYPFLLSLDTEENSLRSSTSTLS
ncbi:hypothetical protein IWW36_003153 [Coemansia brasiliensis]|uniref:non-specific serine/threonine protein kinase n=1 Tax=Coemansia brasiliensis TaxID=2650707 RepID=A0A9W8LYT9_9FUNG|nr:hypothetical protein IWW36_003153 [Coemansia brasiliensis]